MLKTFIRRAASPTRVRRVWIAAWACAWIVGSLAAHAAEPAPPEREAAPFDRYQGWRDEPLLDWRAANERVGEIGGWRSYLRESQQDGDRADDGGHGH